MMDKRLSFLTFLLRLGKQVPNPVPFLLFLQQHLGIFDRFMSLPKNFLFQKNFLGAIPVEIIQCRTIPPKMTIFYVHGGAFILGLNHIYRQFACFLAKRWQAEVILVDYRLAPQHPFPEGLQDCLKAYKALLRRPLSLPLIMAGDSAGANLALATLLSAKEEKEEMPLCVLFLSGWYDLAHFPSSKSVWGRNDPFISANHLKKTALAYLQGKNTLSWKSSPLYGNLKGLPPLFLYVGMAEILLKDSLLLAAQAHAHGVKIHLEVAPATLHVQPLFFPEGKLNRLIMDKMGDFIHSHITMSFPTVSPKNSS